MTTKWQGLWAQERPALYAGRVIKKADIPKYTRLVVRYNKYYEKGSNRPKFVYCFADSTDYADRCVPLEIEDKAEQPYYDRESETYYRGDGERLYTVAEVQSIINDCACYVGGDGEYGEHLVSDFVPIFY